MWLPGPSLLRESRTRASLYPSWSRWVTLAVLAHAFPTVVRAGEHTRHPAPDNLIPLTCNEVARLFITVVIQGVHGMTHRLRRSRWRRRHQARSQVSHYHRQAAAPA